MMYSLSGNRLIEIAYRSEYSCFTINTEKRGERTIMFNKNSGIEYSKCKSEEIEIERKIIPISKIKERCNKSIRILDTNRVNKRAHVYL